MFSNSSFNALLKTLEEPPPHVKFLLATTDPQKVPVTVLSRCLQMNLKRLPLEQIRGQFEHVLGAEGVEAEPAALDLLARVADGSMRDGLSILDQAIAFGGGRVREEEVKAMLGVVAQDRLPGLLRRVADNDAAGLLGDIAQAAEQSPDFSALLKDLLLLLHRVALYQAAPESADASWGSLQAIQELAQRLPAEDIQLFYEIALRGQRDLPLAPDPRSGFEMVLLRMLAFRPGAISKDPAGPLHQPDQHAPENPKKSRTASQGAAPNAAPAASEGQQIPPSAVDLQDWHQVLPRLGLGGLSSQLAAHCTVKSWQNDELVLALSSGGAALAGSMAEKKLQDALENYLGRPLKMRIELEDRNEETPAQTAERQQRENQSAAVRAMQNDPMVQALEEGFDAELLVDSVKTRKP